MYVRALEHYVFTLCVIITRVPRPLYKLGAAPGSYDAVGNTDMCAYYIIHKKVHVHIQMYSVLVYSGYLCMNMYIYIHVCTDTHHVCVVGIV